MALIPFIILLVSNSITYAEWTNITTPDVGSLWSLEDVHFTSSNEGWAVGSVSSRSEYWENTKGVLLHYLDGSWTKITPPKVSSDWYLYSVHFTSPNEGWAVGQDWANNYKGVLLHYLNGSWEKITPPNVSSDWYLNSVHFISPNEGWAVGQDMDKKRGVMLHYSNGSWTSITPPYISSIWHLNAVHFMSVNEGWAVGRDESNHSGVLLHYSNGSWTFVSTPIISSDWRLNSVHFVSPNEGWAVGGCNDKGILLYYLDGSWTKITPPKVSSDWELYGVHFTSPNEGWAVGYNVTNYERAVLFQYLNGSWEKITPPNVSSDWYLNSVHFISPNEGWAVGQDYSNNSGVLLKFFSNISLLFPPDGQEFTSCSYFDLPTFQWNTNETFKSIEIQFSTYSDFSTNLVEVKVSPRNNELLIKSSLWKKVLLLPGIEGGTVYWKVVGTSVDKTKVESNVFSIEIGEFGPVDDPTISLTSKYSLPTFIWNNNCNSKFKVWFGNDTLFNKYTKKKGFTFTIKNPNDNEGIFTKTFTSGQWMGIRKVVADISGSTVYWYVESWDGLNRYTKSEVMSFVLQD